MKKCFIIISLGLLIIVRVVSLLYAQKGAIRYLDEVFSNVSVTSNLAFSKEIASSGEPDDLLLDLYQPVGDTASMRPVIVWIHGGGFYKGDKTDRNMEILAERFARRGYVTVSINYRLAARDALDPALATYSKAALAQAVTNATQDARAALRWLCENAARFRLDTQRIAIGGGSAGAFTSLKVAYTKDEESYNSGDLFKIRAVVDFWGGLLNVNDMKSDGPPLLIIHGTLDKVVPFNFAKRLASRAKDVGAIYEFHPLPGEGHAAWRPMGQYISWISPFLYRYLIEKP